MSKNTLGWRLTSALILAAVLFTSSGLPTSGIVPRVMRAERPPLHDGGGGSAPKPCSVGSLPGQADVTCTGAGTYTIPIDVPPGTNGMQPGLSLVYNSQNGGGILGMGWSMAGLSNITRCAETQGVDSVRGAVNYDANDKYCLDGQRLIAIGQLINGQRQYRTEPESFSRIIAYGQNPANPDYFSVETKDGLVKEYGNTADSNVNAVATNGTLTTNTRVWALNKTSDRSGNYMLYLYDSPSQDGTTGEFRINQIQYTGNTATGLQPYNSVRFFYGLSRNGHDVSPIYQNGTVVTTTSLLSHIQTCIAESCVGTNLVSNYRLGYERGAATERWRLISVMRCDGANVCLPPTTMTWSDAGQTDLTGNTNTAVGGGRQYATDFGHGRNFIKSNTPLYMDAFFPSITAFNQATDAKSQAMAGTMLAISGIGLVLNPVSALVGWAINGMITLVSWFSNTYDLPKGKLADVNGDGRTDIIELPKDPFFGQPQTSFVWESQATGNAYQFTKNTNWPTNQLTALNTNRDIAPDEAKIGDFNGDGKADLLTFGESQEGTAYARISDGSTEFNFDTLQMQAGLLGPIERSLLGDFNGDGRTDVAPIYSNERIYINNLNGDNQITRTADWRDCEQLGLTCGNMDTPVEFSMLGDINGDGKTDLLGFDYSDTANAKVNYLISNRAGNNWTTETPFTFNFGYELHHGDNEYPDLVLPGDFNGDGKLDLAVFIASNWTARINDSEYYTRRGAIKVYLSDGQTFVHIPGFDQVLDTHLHPWGIDYPDNDIDVSFLGRLSDFNGDGKTDLMIFDTLHQAWLMLSEGTSFRPDLQWGGGFGPIDEPQLGDVDGDGRIDVVQFAAGSDDGKIFTTLSNKANFPDLMQTVTNGYGAKSQFTYKPLSDDSVITEGGTSLGGLDADTFNFRGAMYVVSKLETSNGLGGMYGLDYLYQGPKMNRSFGFMGFSAITMTDTQKELKTVTEYEQLYPLKCRKKTETVYSTATRDPLPLKSGGMKTHVEELISQHTWTWSFNPSFPHVIQLDNETDQQKELDNTDLSLDRWTYMYDAYSNVIEKRHTWPDQNDLLVERMSAAYQNYAPTWLIGKPLNMFMYRYEPNEVPVELTTYNYNLTSHILTDMDRELENNRDLTLDYTPNMFGEITNIQVNGTDLNAPRSVGLAYDTRGQFVETLTNPLNQPSTLDFSSAFGHLLELENPDGLPTTFAFDTFGRPKKVTMPDGTSTELILCDGRHSILAPTNTASWVLVQKSGQPDKVFYHDAIGRLIRQTTIGFDSRKILQDSKFTNAKRLQSVSQPYYQGTTPVWTTYGYDQRDRVTATTKPNGQTITTFYSGDSSLVPNELSNLTSRLLWHRQYERRSVMVDPDNEPALMYEYTETLVNRMGQVNQVNRFDNASNRLSSISYDYDGLNQLLKIADDQGNDSTRVYQDRQLISAQDPDFGTRTFVYDVLGQMTQMNLGQANQTMTYDKLGRLKTRTEPEGGTSMWNYDNGPNASGQLVNMTGPNGSQESYTFDQFGRPNTTTTRVPFDAQNYVTTLGYDPQGRVNSITYPDNYVVNHDYNANGYLSQVRNGATMLWQPLSLNEFGQVLTEAYGNLLTTTTAYDRQPAVSAITIGSNLGNPYQKLVYGYDWQGNTRSRYDNTLMPNSQLMEDFDYDALDRVTRSFAQWNNIAGTFSEIRDDQDFGYDSIGNMLIKSNIGGPPPQLDYGARPHAVGSARDDDATHPYFYDNRGNMTSGFDLLNHQQRTINWYSFNKPSAISEPGKTGLFYYDPLHHKNRQDITVNNQTTTTEYIGDIFEKVTLPGGVVESKHYIFGNHPEPVAIHTSRTNNVNETRYFHTDALGSPIMLTNQDGSIAEQNNFDPYGKRRNPDWSPANGPVASLTSLGFTGHEQLDDFGLIDMEGRMYDPQLGHFISADPYQTDPLNSENNNHYSYVANNPATIVDPTGYAYGWEGLGALEIMFGQGGAFASSITSAYNAIGSVFNPSNWSFFQPSYTSSTKPENWWGFYVGPWNPYGYSATPIDLIDLVGYAHDRTYDAFGAAGPLGVFTNLDVLGADMFLIQKMTQLADDESLSPEARKKAWQAAQIFKLAYGEKAIVALSNPGTALRAKLTESMGYKMAQKYYNERLLQVINNSKPPVKIKPPLLR